MMKLISHRGNIEGVNNKTENEPNNILKVIKLGYEVEVDIWKKKKNWYLGHDYPQYRIGNNNKLKKFTFKKRNKYWFHCKNKEAMVSMLNIKSYNFFWHNKDDFTITSKGYFWAYPGQILHKNTVILFPEKFFSIKKIIKQNYYGICSDYVSLFKR